MTEKIKSLDFVLGIVLPPKKQANFRPVFKSGPNMTWNDVFQQEKKAKKTENNLWEEYRALGFLWNNHPLALWKNDVLAVQYRDKA